MWPGSHYQPLRPGLRGGADQAPPPSGPGHQPRPRPSQLSGAPLPRPLPRLILHPGGQGRGTISRSGPCAQVSMAGLGVRGFGLVWL
jgi:hypothetical protein